MASEMFHTLLKYLYLSLAFAFGAAASPLPKRYRYPRLISALTVAAIYLGEERVPRDLEALIFSTLFTSIWDWDGVVSRLAASTFVHRLVGYLDFGRGICAAAWSSLQPKSLVNIYPVRDEIVEVEIWNGVTTSKISLPTLKGNWRFTIYAVVHDSNSTLVREEAVTGLFGTVRGRVYYSVLNAKQLGYPEGTTVRAVLHDPADDTEFACTFPWGRNIDLSEVVDAYLDLKAVQESECADDRSGSMADEYVDEYAE